MTIHRKTWLAATLIPAIALVSACQDTATVENVDIPAVEEVVVPEIEVFPYEAGSSAFETWYVLGDVAVRDSVVYAPDGTPSGDALNFGGDALLTGVWAQTSVSSGERVGGSVWLWAEAPTQAAIFLVPACGSSTEDSSLTYVDVTEEPTRFEFEHTFEDRHECVQIQMKAMQPPVIISSWKARLN